MRAIDLFAGWGGFTLGAELAGVHVAWAANHWPLAVEAHSVNHPRTEHACQDLRQADWTALPSYELLLASPACQGHSQASQPKRRRYHDAMRATAWAVVDCADVTEPRALVVENVPDFRRWRLYPLWREALEALGFRLQEHVVRASHHGALSVATGCSSSVFGTIGRSSSSLLPSCRSARTSSPTPADGAPCRAPRKEHACASSAVAGTSAERSSHST